MKRLAYIMALVLLAAGAFAESIWTDDFAKARETAKAENRFLYLNFTGSDWCGWCIKLRNEVFVKSAFKKYARENLVCVEVDFPAQKTLSQAVRDQNDNLKNAFAVTGYPTIVLLSPNGELVTIENGYRAGGAELYVKHLEELLAPFVEKFGKPTVSTIASDEPVELEPDDTTSGVRTWTSTTGNTIDATYQQLVTNQVELRLADGSAVRIEMSLLSDADREYLRSIKVIQ